MKILKLGKVSMPKVPMPKKASFGIKSLKLKGVIQPLRFNR